MNAYKFLAAGARGRFSDARWPTPAAEGLPGAWLAAVGELEECRRGIHACTGEQLLDWIDDELWELELAAPVVATEAGLVAPRGRLLRRVAAWNAELASRFARRCASRVHDHAVAGLRRGPFRAQAEALASAQTLAEVNALVAAAAEAGAGEATTAAAFVADCLLLEAGARPDGGGERHDGIRPSAAAIAANLAFVSAHAVAATSGDYDAAFAAERCGQLDWLRAQLAL